MTPDAPPGETLLPLELNEVSLISDGKKLLDNISAVFDAGPRTVILGPNGAGKSLMLRVAHGLIVPSAGNVRWAGTTDRRRQAMVFSRPVMLRRSALANVVFALKVGRRETTRHARVARAEAALDITGLTPLARRLATTLSTGEQQRLALARAWALDPEVVFLDEPTANLDPAAAHAVEDLIRQFAEQGTKIVMTTHDLALARRLGDDILLLHHGKLVERGDASHFFAEPRTDVARAFLAGALTW